MEKKIALNGREISYRLKRFKNSKRLRLSITRERGLLVTAPKRTPLFFIELAIKRQEDWIAAFLHEPATSSRGRYEENKEKARMLAEERLSFWNRNYGFFWKSISVRDQCTRWGSCSRKGNLNFNYRIALLPSHLADYVVVHELCHLKEMNHSPRFWALVAQAIPDWPVRRKELKAHGF